MGIPLDTYQGNIEVPKAPVEDGLYHPGRYQGGDLVLTHSPNGIAPTPAVPPAAAAATEPALVSQSKWQPTLEQTQNAAQTSRAMSTSGSVASLTTSASYETAALNETTATVAPFVPASKPDHSAAYAIVSVLVVVVLIGGFIAYWLRKKDRYLRSKLAMYNNPGQKTPHEPNPHMKQLKRLGCSIKSKTAVSFGAISNLVKTNNDSNDQLSSLESNQSETWPSLPHTVISYDDVKTSTQPRTKIERFKGLGVKIMDLGFMIRIARDKGSDLIRGKSMIVKDKVSAIMTDKGMIIKDKSMAFFNSASDFLSWRNNTVEAVSTHSKTWSPSTSNDSFHNHCPESVDNLKSPNTSNHVYEHNSPGGLSVSSLSISLRRVSSGKGQNVESPTATAPCSCAISRVSSRTTKSEEAVPVPGIIGQHAGASASSIEVFRKKVYRVDMPYNPRSDGELAVQEGDYVIISQIFDNGWVGSCSNLDSSSLC